MGSGAMPGPPLASGSTAMACSRLETLSWIRGAGSGGRRPSARHTGMRRVASWFRSSVRARDRRERTVPMDTPSAFAASS